MNKRKFPITNIGSVSLLTILIVLCMVTFAALSLSTSATDYRSAQTLADHTTAYYKASEKAEKKLAKVDRILEDCYLTSSDESGYLQLVREKLGITTGTIPLTYSYQTRISTSQKLQVELEVIYPDGTSSDGFYKITRWQAVSSEDWNADNSIRLIQ